MPRRIAITAVAFMLALGSRAAGVELLGSPDDICGRAALIAHVCIAGELKQGERARHERLWLAEIIDTAQGPAEHELVLVTAHGDDAAATHLRSGASLILFASRDADGVYRPLEVDAGCWPIDSAGKLRPHRYAELLSPAAASGDPADAITWWWNETRQHALEISLALNESDLRNYKPERPLRLQVTIDNAGGRPLSLNNCIEFEYRTPGDVQKEIIHESLLPAVKIFAQPLTDEHVLSDLEKLMRANSPLSLAAGQRCAGEYDLSQESQIYGGMRYQVWAEVGTHQSPPIVFELPGQPEAVMLMEKMEELDDDGPLHIVERPDGAPPSMLPVQPTDEAQVIDAALNLWLASEEQVSDAESLASDDLREVVLLRRANLPLEFCGSDRRHLFIICDRHIKIAKGDARFALHDGEAVFRGRALRIECVDVARQMAHVELREVGEDRPGTGAVIRLRREQAAWRLASEIDLVQN